MVIVVVSVTSLVPLALKLVFASEIVTSLSFFVFDVTLNSISPVSNLGTDEFCFPRWSGIKKKPLRSPLLLVFNVTPWFGCSLPGTMSSESPTSTSVFENGVNSDGLTANCSSSGPEKFETSFPPKKT